jgi:hypothetical protein
MTEEKSSAADARAHLKEAARSLIAAARAALDVAEGIVENPPSRPAKPGPSANPRVQRIRVQPDDDDDNADADDRA